MSFLSSINWFAACEDAEQQNTPKPSAMADWISQSEDI